MADPSTQSRRKCVAFVINPVSGSGAGLHAWKKVRPAVEHRFGTACTHVPLQPISTASDHNEEGSFVELLTGGPGDAWHLTREAIESGCGAVVCLGGDGTVNEAVNGYMEGEFT
jgi:diacylglycerol kinase family enzyme